MILPSFVNVDIVNINAVHHEVPVVEFSGGCHVLSANDYTFRLALFSAL